MGNNARDPPPHPRTLHDMALRDRHCLSLWCSMLYWVEGGSCDCRFKRHVAEDTASDFTEVIMSAKLPNFLLCFSLQRCKLAMKMAVVSTVIVNSSAVLQYVLPW